MHFGKQPCQERLSRNTEASFLACGQDAQSYSQSIGSPESNRRRPCSPGSTPALVHTAVFFRR
ncbi:MAG: hypothetical protein Q9183_004762, partial [Haloplaca sp. 2 TL-2023]